MPVFEQKSSRSESRAGAGRPVGEAHGKQVTVGGCPGDLLWPHGAMFCRFGCLWSSSAQHETGLVESCREEPGSEDELR